MTGLVSTGGTNVSNNIWLKIYTAKLGVAEFCFFKQSPPDCSPFFSILNVQLKWNSPLLLLQTT